MDEYDEDGVARMLVDVLTRTLGITESRLADVLKYLSYDGVYAEKEERVAGGGSVKIGLSVAQVLNRSEVLGMWDPAHQLQIIWNKLISPGKSQNSLVKKVLEVYVKPMQDFNTGQAGQVFKDIAEDVGNLILTNKTTQTTRFVRSFLRCLETGLRNIATFVAMYGKLLQEALARNGNTEAKRLKKLIDGLTNPTNIFSAIGLLQVLEIYTRYIINYLY